MYKCPKCEKEIKKGVNKCPDCGQDLDWVPLCKGQSKPSSNQIVSKVTVNTPTPSANTTAKAKEKLFNQMFSAISKLWTFKVYKLGDSTRYEAYLNVTTSDEPVVIKQAPVVRQEKPVVNTNYVVNKAPNKPITPPPQKAELLDFARRLQDSAMPFNPGN